MHTPNCRYLGNGEWDCSGEPPHDLMELALECGMLLAILMATLLACWAIGNMPQKAKWDGQKFTCPKGTQQWVSEPEALAGKQDYVYCVR